jgi:hypothetical protein
MADVIVFPTGGYRYVAGVFQYSAAVAAEPDFAIERATFLRPPPLAEGFAAAAAHLEAVGRPLHAFAACELRSPAPFTDRGFHAFNEHYVRTLESWGIYRQGVNPVARTNVCPEHGGPAEPVMHAFSYTVPAEAGRPGTFVVSGSGEARDGSGDYANSTVRLGETSPEALHEKLLFVRDVMERRMGLLGFGWKDATAVQAYAVHDIGFFVGPELARRGAIGRGLTWHIARPPIVDIEVELDVRATAREVVL